MTHDFNGNKNNAAASVQEGQKDTGKISAVTSIGARQIDDSICDLSIDDMLNTINAGNRKAPIENVQAKEEEASEEEKTGILRRHNPAILEERLKLEEAERERRKKEEKAEEEALRLRQERLRRLNPLSLFKKKQDKEQEEQKTKNHAAEVLFTEEAEEQLIKTEEEDLNPLQDKTPEKGGKWINKTTKEKPQKKEPEVPKEKAEKVKSVKGKAVKVVRDNGPQKKNRQSLSFADLISFVKKEKKDIADANDSSFSNKDNKDPLTGFLNEKAFDGFKTQDALGQSVIFIQVRGMDEIENTFGQSACSLTLITVSREIEKIFTKSTCCYVGDNKFAVLPPTSDNSFKKISGNINTLEEALALSAQNDMMPYFISAGYCVAEKSLPFSEAVKAAEKILQEEILGTDKEEAPAEERQKKPAVHTAVSNFTEDVPVSEMKAPEKDSDMEDKPLSGIEYDEQLTPAQRRLRASVINYHSQPTIEQIEATVNMIESHYDRVTAVFMADSEFSTLCVFRNVDTFIDIVKEADYNIDYSYCYVLLESETHCYGNDPDNNEVTKIFENLANALKCGKVRCKEDITKINGINIFHNILFE